MRPAVSGRFHARGALGQWLLEELEGAARGRTAARVTTPIATTPSATVTD